MTPEERQLLSALAQRVSNVPPQQTDPEAEQFIRQLVMQRPDTPYVLAQTAIMQDFALRNAADPRSKSCSVSRARWLRQLRNGRAASSASCSGGLRHPNHPHPLPAACPGQSMGQSGYAASRPRLWRGSSQGYGAGPGQGLRPSATRPGDAAGADGLLPSGRGKHGGRSCGRRRPTLSRASSPCFQAITAFRIRPWRASTPKTASAKRRSRTIPMTRAAAAASNKLILAATPPTMETMRISEAMTTNSRDCKA